MKVKTHVCVGGTPVKEDVRILKNGVHVVVGTPGRIHDMMKRGFLKTEYLKLFILDEADDIFIDPCSEGMVKLSQFITTNYTSWAFDCPCHTS